MSRSSPRKDRTRERGQTEPLAALIAVATVCIALTLYAGYVMDVLPGTSERAVEDAAIERVWHELEENGVYDPDTDPEVEDIGTEALPQGYAVHVNVTTITEDGDVEVVDSAYFEPDGSVGTLTDDPPEDARTASRPVAIKFDDGDIRGGTLRVVVW